MDDEAQKFLWKGKGKRGEDDPPQESEEKHK
jgi:hypothetical protein